MQVVISERSESNGSVKVSSEAYKQDSKSRRNKIKKALKTILLFVLVMAMLIPTTVTTFAASLPIQATNEYIVLQKANYVFNSGDDRQVESVKTVYDFAGNTFYVAECTPTG